MVHEVAHQWWSQLVGVDSIDWGFLDEGLTCWSHSYFGEYAHQDWEYFQYDRYLDVVRTFHEEYGIDTAINQSNYDMIEFESYIGYTKAPLIFEKLRIEIGHEKFIEGLGLFCKQNYFGVGTLAGLQAAMEVVCEESLDWFFLPWFDNPRLPDYSFTDVVYDRAEGTLVVTIEDENEASNPYSYSQQVPIRVLSSTDEVLYDEVVWINGTTTLTLEVAGEPDEVSLLYDNYILVELTEQGIHSLTTRNIQIVGGFPIVLTLVGIAVLAPIAIVAVLYIRRRGS